MAEDIPQALAEGFRDFHLLGQGTYGKVFRAVDRELGRTVAVKLLVARFDADDHVRARFLREARLAAAVRSPRVTELYDYGFADEHPYIVFQYIEGRTLKDVLRRQGGRMPVAEAGRVMLELLEGLEALHAAGVVHRDLKPQNVLVDKAGDVFVADLGLATAEGETTLTRTGQVVGTPGYMSPEQMEGEPADPTCDLYAAGMIFQELLSGALAFGQDSFTAVYARKAGGTRKPLGEVVGGVPEGLDSFLDALMAAKVRDRPPTAAAARSRLEAVLRGRGDPGARAPAGAESAALPRATTREVASPRRGRGPALLALGVAAATIAALAPGREAPPPPPPPPVVSAPPAEAPDAALRRLRRRVLKDPQIAEAMALQDTGEAAQAMAAWEAARRAFRVHAPRIRGVLDLLGPGVPPPEIFEEVARLLMVERLLATTRRPGVPPLFGPKERGSGLAEVHGRGVELFADPRLRGIEPGDPRELDAGALEILSRGGRAWEVRRSILPHSAGGEKGAARIKVRNHAGEYFVDPAHLLGAMARDFRNSVAPNFQASPEAAEFPLRALPGDLHLALHVFDWSESFHGWLRLEGGDRVLPVVLTPPKGAATGFGEAIPREVLHLRVARRLVPRALHRGRLELVGLQPIGDPSVTVNIGAVFQQTAGPPPTRGGEG